MTRREFFCVGAPLSERPDSYLFDCLEADVWAHQAVTAIANYASLMRDGVLEPAMALAAMQALSEQE